MRFWKIFRGFMMFGIVLLILYSALSLIGSSGNDDAPKARQADASRTTNFNLK